MTGHQIEVLSRESDVLGESPVWCASEGALYWVDIRGPALRRLDLSTGRADRWTLPELCGAVILREKEGVLVALMSGIFAFRPETGALERLVSPEPPGLGNRMNDSKCDRRGRIWTGTMRDFGAATSGSLYRIDRWLGCTRVLSDITVPNALAWSPDDRRMYFADSADGRLRAYDFEPEGGRLGPCRILVENGAAPGKPDGATVDAAGCVWNARYGAGCVLRFTPEGAVDRRIELPVAQVTSCAFGGPDLRTLFITTSRQKLSPEELEAQPLAGCLFAVRLDVPGLPEPCFPG